MRWPCSALAIEATLPNTEIIIAVAQDGTIPFDGIDGLVDGLGVHTGAGVTPTIAHSDMVRVVGASLNLKKTNLVLSNNLRIEDYKLFQLSPIFPCNKLIDVIG